MIAHSTGWGFIATIAIVVFVVIARALAPLIRSLGLAIGLIGAAVGVIAAAAALCALLFAGLTGWAGGNQPSPFAMAAFAAALGGALIVLLLFARRRRKPD